MHRRTEMTDRIKGFDEKCELAIENVKKLQMQTQNFVHQLDCGPGILKDRFLHLMKTLDEYTYLITDFNLAMAQLDHGSIELTPVQDDRVQSLVHYNFTDNNLLDVLSEPGPSTSRAISNPCPQRTPNRREPNENQLITFSDSSSESLSNRNSSMVTREVQCSLSQDLANMSVAAAPTPRSSPELLLPPQRRLQVDQLYNGIISVIAGGSFWIVTDDCREFYKFMRDITEYHKQHNVPMTKEQANQLTYCAYYDENTKIFYRGLFVADEKDEFDKVSIFLVDTGEIRMAGLECLRHLAEPFFRHAPYARYCHWGGVDLIEDDRDLMQAYETFMFDYLRMPCQFRVDEDCSESLGVFVELPSGETLNEILVERGMAKFIEGHEPLGVRLDDEWPQSPPRVLTPSLEQEGPQSTPWVLGPSYMDQERSMSPAQSLTPSYSEQDWPPTPRPSHFQGPPEELQGGFDGFDLDCPEHDDPVVAVTGYHNRDEADICKHYRGGHNTTCFKGARCTKKHIVRHPDGWTEDHVQVLGKFKEIPLPGPESWFDVLVTGVAHYDRVFVHIIDEDNETDEVPDFGVMLAPTTLNALVLNMNSPAMRNSYQHLQLTPAPGEMVAALYTPDNRWYRARVLASTRADQSVEVMYVDYGTVMWIREDQIRVLEERFAQLPMQAVRCVLAGVRALSRCSRDWARAKRALTELVQDQRLHCHVVARGFDDITVELILHGGISVADKLMCLMPELIEITEYEVSKEEPNRIQVVVP